ncbi:MAG: hypothetical protein RR847_02460 [Bacilli bacterium]
MNGFLIPANSKKSMLIFGLFNKFDLILFGSGVSISFILLMVLPVDNIWVALAAIGPGLITGFLVMPVPNYHNILTIIQSMFRFYTNRQKFIWKGWCYLYEKSKKTK